MKLSHIFDEAKYQHIRRVLKALGPERIDKALTAFDDGKSNWSQCFFARAVQGEVDLNKASWKTIPADISKRGIIGPEYELMKLLGLSDAVSIRFVWQSFDSAHATGMTRKKLKSMIEEILAVESAKDISKEMEQFLNEVNFDPNQQMAMDCLVPKQASWPNNPVTERLTNA